MKIASLFLAFLFAACAFGQPIDFTRDYNFPPVGLASTETAQINLVNIVPVPTATATATNTPEAPACTGTVTFTNASGAVIGKPATFTTTGSQVTSIQLMFSQLQLSSTDVRGEFVTSVQLTHSLSAAASCSLVFSLETFDSSTGVTHVYLGNSATGTALVGNPIAVHTGAN